MHYLTFDMVRKEKRGLGHFNVAEVVSSKAVRLTR